MFAFSCLATRGSRFRESESATSQLKLESLEIRRIYLDIPMVYKVTQQCINLNKTTLCFKAYTSHNYLSPRE